MNIVLVETSTTGAGQRLIEASRKKDHRLILLSQSPNDYPTESIDGISEIVRCDTSDWVALYAAASTLMAKHGFDAVTTVSDLHVPQAAFLAEQFSLPGMPVRAACRARNKYLTRLTLSQKAPDISPQFCIAKTPEEMTQFLEKYGPPVIAKPQNANDSLGVQRLHDGSDVKAYIAELQAMSQSGTNSWLHDGVLMEEYLDGTEFSCEVVIAKGQKPIVFGVCDRTFFGAERGLFVEIGVSFPFRGNECPAIETAVLKALAALEIDCGVIHTECRVTSTGVKIVEVNPRLAGDMVGSHALTYAMGRSPLEAVIDVALGQFEGWHPKHDRGGAMYALVASKSGRFDGICNLNDIKDYPGIQGVREVAKVGDMVRPATNNGEILLQLVAGGNDHKHAHRLAMAAVEACDVSITPV